jgi:hypothetical protein
MLSIINICYASKKILNLKLKKLYANMDKDKMDKNGKKIKK